jgi:pyridoxamine 5'-phosphate oxidase
VSVDLPPFYDDLTLSLNEARIAIEAGARDRRQPAHCPTVATLGADGEPTQRVMILREMDWAKRSLRFHTDARTAKVPADPACSVLFYDPPSKLQLRLSGAARILLNGDEVDKAWDSSTLFARRCYLAENAPGALADAPVSGLPDWVEGRQPTETEVASARQNFALLVTEFDRIEWLYLANAGHRRARWTWDAAAGDWQGNWLIP